MTSKIKEWQSPNDTLATQTVNKLVEAGLISNSKIEEITSKVKAGTATSEDWRLWIELTLSQSDQPEGKNGVD